MYVSQPRHYLMGWVLRVTNSHALKCTFKFIFQYLIEINVSIKILDSEQMLLMILLIKLIL